MSYYEDVYEIFMIWGTCRISVAIYAIAMIKTGLYANFYVESSSVLRFFEKYLCFKILTYPNVFLMEQPIYFNLIIIVLFFPFQKYITPCIFLSCHFGFIFPFSKIYSVYIIHVDLRHFS